MSMSVQSVHNSGIIHTYIKGKDLESNIQKVKDLRECNPTDKKICLFVGRGANQTVPNENTNEIWISLNDFDQEPLNGRIH